MVITGTCDPYTSLPDTGSLSSPGYPQIYPTNVRCGYHIEVDDAVS